MVEEGSSLERVLRMVEAVRTYLVLSDRKSSAARPAKKLQDWNHIFPWKEPSTDLSADSMTLAETMVLVEENRLRPAGQEELRVQALLVLLAVLSVNRSKALSLGPMIAQAKILWLKAC